MIQPIDFYAVGEPKGQPRPKAFARKVGNTFVARVFDPGTAEHWKTQIATAANGHLPTQPIETPVYLRLEFFFQRPKGHFRTGKNAGQMREGAPGWHTSKPDADNAAKAVMDALTVLRVWRDDSQVVELRVLKRYEDGRGPGCQIRISEA